MGEVFKHSYTQYTVIKNKEFSEIQDISDDELNFLKRRKIVKFDAETTYNTEESYLENYGNLLCSVDKSYCLLVVEKKSNKISLKIFYGNRKRLAGRPYFTTSKNMKYATVNTDTGDFYSGYILDYQKKRKYKKVLQKNHFKDDFLRRMLNIWKDLTNQNCNSIFSEALNVFKENLGIPVISETREQLLKFYLDKKKIKYPNNFVIFWNDNFPSLKLKDIKKSDLKLVDSFMEKNSLSGNNLKKALHICNHINLKLIKYSYELFPEDWLNKDYKIISKILEYQTATAIYSNIFPFYYENLSILKSKKNELRRVFEIFLIVLENKINMFSFIDHVRFYCQLKSFGENKLKWKSNDLDSFNDEHLYFSELVQEYTEGNYQRFYPQNLTSLIEKPIDAGEKYFPILLDSSENYNRESSVQSNCVRTYIGRPGSLIVSIRKNSEDSDERATMEIKFHKENGKIRFTCPQFLGRFNNKLDNDWESTKDILLNRLNLISEKEFENPKIQRVFPNGRKLISDSEWDENGNLFWNKVDITSYIC